MSKLITYLISIVALTAVALRAFFFYTSVVFLPTTTDEAAAMLLAKSIAAGKETPLLFWGQPYQFPIEAYLLSIFQHLLPRDAFGARVVFAVVASFSIIGFCLTYKTISERGNYWPGLLLVLVSSPYLLTLQSAYFIPQYTMMLTFFWLILFLTALVIQNRNDLILILTLGLCCGLSLSNHLLILPFVLAVSLVVCVSDSFKRAMKSSFFYVLGFLLGLSPYLASLAKTKDYASSITGSYSMAEAFERFLSPLISKNLATVFGFNLCLFPDYQIWRGLFPYLAKPGMFVFWSFLSIVTLIRVYKLILTLIKNRWPVLSINDVVVGTSWLCLMAFSFSTRGRDTEYRYFLPLAWCFPFILSYLFAISLKYFRYLLSSLALAFVCINFAQTLKLISIWTQPAFAAKAPDMPEIKPVIEYLDEGGISYCYASFWFAYRFTYETDERLICSQQYNERFPGWLLPYKQEVDEAKKVAYVVSATAQSRFLPGEFLGKLIGARIEFKSKEIPPYVVFHDFSYKGLKNSVEIKKENYEMLFDNSLLSVKQRKGMSFVIFFKEEQTINRLRLFFGDKKASDMPTIKIKSSLDGKKYQVLRHQIKPAAGGMRMDGEHPIFTNKNEQEIFFNASKMKFLRVSIVEPVKDKFWVIPELKIFGESLS